MTIDIECVYTPEDYVNAQFLHMRARRWLYYFVAGFCALLIILFALDTYLHSTPDHWPIPNEPTDASIPIWVWLSIPIVYLIGSFYIYIPWRARRIFAQSKGLQLPIRFSFGDEGMAAENATSKESIPWDHIRKWREDRKLFLFYANDVMFYMIPKRYLVDEERLASLRAMLGSQAARIG